MARSRRSHAAARSGQRVTSGQLVDFHQQVSDGLITKPSLQEYLIGHGRPFGGYPRLSPGQRKERVGIWSNRIGSEEVAEGLMGYFEPFYALEEVRLGLAPPDIDRRCREAIFWVPRGGAGALTLTVSQLVGETAVSGEFNELMRSALLDPLYINPDDETDAIWEDANIQWFTEETLFDRLLDLMAEECDRNGIFWSDTESGTVWQNDVAWHAKEDLKWCLNTVYHHLRYGHPAMARLYIPLLRLFLDGLWPLGLTDDRRLAMLCSDAE